ncbi:hypothetical protein TRAPUB_13873 [Trametes pubescens]|uniref:Uncharacterized protein n=1 Tax=Trametes pubescens TaxID=154538 RepID=A0A1M2VPY4_TRAPU|nr:hypothetical protein TRAPUB_13873 [Trametes pubescens]
MSVASTSATAKLIFLILPQAYICPARFLPKVPGSVPKVFPEEKPSGAAAELDVALEKAVGISRVIFHTSVTTERIQSQKPVDKQILGSSVLEDRLNPAYKLASTVGDPG